MKEVEYIRSPLGLGWFPSELQEEKDEWWWVSKIFGLLLTGVAVTFGAPFWFSVLKKLLSLRGGGSSGKAATTTVVVESADGDAQTVEKKGEES